MYVQSMWIDRMIGNVDVGRRIDQPWYRFAKMCRQKACGNRGGSSPTQFVPLAARILHDTLSDFHSHVGAGQMPFALSFLRYTYLKDGGRSF